MENIKITVSIGENEITREYAQELVGSDNWGDRVVDMLDTLEKSTEDKFSDHGKMIQVDPNVHLK